MSEAPALPRRLLSRARRALLGTVVGAHTTERVAALTFDDGPDPASTPELLDLLARHGARATFFLVGTRAARHPDLVARIADGGHAVGYHSWDHPSLPRLGQAAIARQLARTRAALGPRATRLMRPPYGDQSLASHLAARRQGLVVVGWSVDGVDWAGEPADAIAARVLEGLHPGAIVLLHDSLFSWLDPRFRERAATLAAVQRVLAAGTDYVFLTVPELLARGRPRKRYWIQPPDPELLGRLIADDAAVARL
jgi:peptidoglycan/xylan/chitin deacetylase (PgdA/CDA1 family)